MAADPRLMRAVSRLLERADLLEALGENPHRIRAYRTAAGVLEQDAHRFSVRLAKRNFSQLSGIGRELSAKIVILADGGELSGADELNARVPPHASDLLVLPGVDRKLAIYLTVRLNIHSVAQLRQLVKSHMLRTIPWLDPARERDLRLALGAWEAA